MARTPRTTMRQKRKGPIDPLFGKRVRQWRTVRKMTQRQLAMPEFTPGFISLVETGRTRVSLRAAEILGRKLDVDAVRLIDRHGHPRAPRFILCEHCHGSGLTVPNRRRLSR